MRYQAIIEFDTPNDYYGSKVVDGLMETVGGYQVNEVSLMFDGPAEDSPVAGDPRLYEAV